MTGKPQRGWTANWAWCLFAVLGVALSSGCAGSTPSPFAEGVGSSQSRQLNVWVRSANRAAVEVTLVGNGGQRVELGRLEARGSEVFTVQWHDSLIRARIALVGGRRFTTPFVLLTNQVGIVIDVDITIDRSRLRAN